MSKYPKPKYYITQADIISKARVQVLHLEEYLDHFNAVDKAFNKKFIAKYRELIEYVLNIESDRGVRAQISQYRQTVKVETEKAKAFYHKVQYFVKQVFPDSYAHLNQFGKSKFEKVKYSNTKLLYFIFNINDVLIKYRNENVGGEIFDKLIEEGTELFEKFEEAVSKLDSYKKERRSITEHRIEYMNKLWELMKLVSNAAEIAFLKDPILTELFKLPRKRKPKRQNVIKEEGTEAADNS